MSLNTTHTPDGHGIILYNGEQIFLGGFVGGGVVLTLEKETVPHLDFKGKKKGQLYLTTNRIIFKTDVQEKGNFRSFSIPFHCLRSVKLEQPILGANYLTGIVLAQPGGNWEGSATWRLTFNKGGCIDFGRALLEINDKANSYRPMDAPPAYAPPPGAYFAPPPEYYMQTNDYYGFRAPVQAFPDQPPVGTVFMYEQPPPYPGIGPNQLPLQPGLYPQVNVQDPSAPFPSAPPSYDQATALPQKS